MGNLPSRQEFDAAQDAAREQGRQEMRQQLDEFGKACSARERQEARAAALEDGEVAEDSRGDSGADSATDTAIKVKKEEAVEAAVTFKREPNASDTANEKFRLLERHAAAEQELAAARLKTVSSGEDLLSGWKARKEKLDKTRLGISSATIDSRKNNTETDVRSPKRAAPDSGYSDERRSSKRKASSSSGPQSPSRSSGRNPPEWYNKMERKGTRSKQESEAEPLLNGLKTQIKKAQDQRPGFQDAFEEARDRIHKIAFVQVTKQALRNSRILDNENGLPQIFDPQYAKGVSWPFDVKADAEELYNKWCREDFETDLMRGINSGKPNSKSGKNDRTSDSIQDGYPKLDAQKYGNNNLLNGQWWPTQLTCLRDGAHGSSQAGVSGGEIGRGPYSCVMSGGHGYGHDEDNGDTVLYCGTDSKDGKPTDATQRLINSIGKDPVRFIRSHQLGSKSKWAPAKGFRYDGLYNVVSGERVDPDGNPRARYRFKLERVPGQDPIRGGDGPERRPTVQEVEAYNKDKRLRGF